MTSRIDVVRRYIEEGYTNPPASIIETGKKYLSDDFQSLDKDGKVVMNKEAYIGMSKMLLPAFSDFRFMLKDLRLEGDSVIMSGHFEGTHTRDLDLSAMGKGVITASGKKIVWLEADVEWKVEGDKILSQKPYGGASGLEAFLAPLGVKLPAA